MTDFVNALGEVLSAPTMYGSTIRFATLLVLAAAGEWVAEKAGTINISLEGMMLTGSFTAALGSFYWGNAALAVAFGVVGGLAVAVVQANMSHRLSANQFVVGLTLNVLAVGLTSYLYAQIKPLATRAGEVRIPLLADIPIFGEAFFGQTWVLYTVYGLVPLAWWLIYRTRWGLEVRSTGENPQAADVSGIDANKRRRQSIYFCGLAAGLAGAYLTIGQVGAFGMDGVAGRGFVAMAAVILGGWTLRGTVGAAVVFGFFDALRFALPSLGYSLNAQFLGALPYVMALATMLVLAGHGHRPAALTKPFVRGLH